MYEVVDLATRLRYGEIRTKKEAMLFRTKVRAVVSSDMFLEVGSNIVVMPAADATDFSQATQGPCPMCGEMMQYGDETYDERVCDTCGSV